jgi:putative acetyltransferase
MEITIERLSRPTADASALIAELDEVLGALYEPEQRHGLSIAQVFQPNVRFFVARLGERAVGCGAVALCDGYAEVKRMYTREAARGRGVGKALLARIEREACDAGKPILCLETGTLQAAAIGLYEARGFRPCDPVRPLRRAAAAPDCRQPVLRKAAVRLQRCHPGEGRIHR